MKGAPVVVIGSGLGGLAGAVTLAAQGKEVLLLEKEPRTGGYAISFQRSGFTFDLSLHVVPSGGPGQEFAAMIERLGITDQVRFVRLREGFKVILGDYRFQMPGGYRELQDRLGEAFPGEQNGVAAFFRDLEKHVARYGGIFDYTVPQWQAVPKFLPGVPAFLKHCRMSTAEYLGQFFGDDRIKAILYQPAAFMGIPMKDFPTVNFMMMSHLLLKGGMYTIDGGGQALSRAIRERFLALGGKLLTGVTASRIHVEGGKAVAVSTMDGSRYDCNGVICGNSIHEVVNTLVGRDHFHRTYLDNLDQLTPSLSVMALNLGLDCHPRELGIDSYITMAYPDADLDTCLTRQARAVEMTGFSVTAPVNAVDSVSPQDAHVVSIVGGTDPARWLKMDGDTYRCEKSRVAAAAIDRADTLFPGLRDHVRVADLATPRTMQRYTANPGGAIMGFNCTCGRHRSIMQAARVPIGNLVMGGAWTGRLGGYMQCVKSGILAAESLLGR